MLARGTEALSPWTLVACADHLHEELIQELRSLYDKTSFSLEPADSSVEVRGAGQPQILHGVTGASLLPRHLGDEWRFQGGH